MYEGTIIFAFLLSLLFSIVILLNKKLLRAWGVGYGPKAGPQKIHEKATPRVGGIGIYLGFAIASLTAILKGQIDSNYFLLCILPIFIAGLIEDFYGTVSPSIRLIFSLITGGLLCFLTDSIIRSVGVAWIDELLQIQLIAISLSVFAIASMINAVNIIDGLNGLASGTTVIVTAGIIAIGWHASGNGYFLFQAMFLGAVVGVMLLNFPLGKLFVGDSGAYIMGATLAWSAIFLPQSAPNISPFASLLLVAYPLYELCRTVVRRLASGRGLMRPDDHHLHSLIYKLAVVNWQLDKRIANPVSTLLVLTLPFGCTLFAFIFQSNKYWLLFSLFGVVIVYEALTMLVKIKTKPIV